MAGVAAVLPKYVVFRSCDAGMTNTFHRQNVSGGMYLQFNNAPGDIWEVTAVAGEEDGTVRLQKLDDSNSVWRKAGNANWVMSDGSGSAADANSRFMVQVRGIPASPSVTIKSLVNNLFINMTTQNAIKECASANWANLNQAGAFRVIEPVNARTVCDFLYKMDGVCPPYKSEKKVMLAEGCAINKGCGCGDADMNVQLTFADTKTQSWSNSVSLNGCVFKAVPMSMNLGDCIPTADSDSRGIKMQPWTGSSSVTNVLWGHKFQQSPNKTISYNVSVPRGKAVKVQLFATLAEFQVPFTYTQSDTLTNGSTRSQTRSDGIFFGSNYYAFDYKLVDSTSC